mgnify:CR=1 FL=1
MTSAGSPERTPILRLNRRARLLLPIFLVILAGVTIHRLWMAPPSGPPMLELSGPTMGTTFSVKVSVDSVRAGEADTLSAVVERTLARVNALMSTWDPESELSRFNRHLSSDPYPISRETGDVLRIAREVSRASNGAFDVTVMPEAELVESIRRAAGNLVPTDVGRGSRRSPAVEGSAVP